MLHVFLDPSTMLTTHTHSRHDTRTHNTSSPLYTVCAMSIIANIPIGPLYSLWYIARRSLSVCQCSSHYMREGKTADRNLASNQKNLKLNSILTKHESMWNGGPRGGRPSIESIAVYPSSPILSLTCYKPSCPKGYHLGT